MTPRTVLDAVPAPAAPSTARRPAGATEPPAGPDPVVADGAGESVPEGVDPLSYRVFAAFTRALRAHGQLLIRILGEQGTHPGQAFCLRTLARQDGMSQRDLAATLHVSPPTVTAMLQRMERSGMVRRAVDEGDQRITRVYLTDDGRRIERSLSAVLLAYSATVLDSIPTDDRLELERLLGRLADNISAVLADEARERGGDDGDPEGTR